VIACAASFGNQVRFWWARTFPPYRANRLAACEGAKILTDSLHFIGVSLLVSLKKVGQGDTGSRCQIGHLPNAGEQAEIGIITGAVELCLLSGQICAAIRRPRFNPALFDKTGLN
jgi:hypothetical protein